MDHIVEMLKREWRELGFYYDFDERITVNQRRFFGSKNGLRNLVSLFQEIIEDPYGESISEDYHYGPYSAKIMVWDKPILSDKYIAGSFADFKFLIQLLTDKLEAAVPGSTFPVWRKCFTLVSTRLQVFSTCFFKAVPRFAAL